MQNWLNFSFFFILHRSERDFLREELEKCGEKIKYLSGEVAQTEALAQDETKDAILKAMQLQEDINKEHTERILVQEELCQCKQVNLLNFYYFKEYFKHH